jgi:cyclopropane fatty-acyl-phospholipid synthase-like methyltransferase
MTALWTVNAHEQRWTVWDEHIANALDADLSEARIGEYPARTAGAWALDLGCNIGHTYDALHRAGYHTIGMEPSWAEACASQRYAQRRTLPTWSIQGEPNSIPLPSHSVEMVVAVGMMYHLGVFELPTALAEIRRVLNYGGRALIHFLDINDCRRDLGHEATIRFLPTVSDNGLITCFCTVDFIRQSIAKAGLRITRMDFVTRADKNGQRRNWIAHCQRGGFAP